ncbi:hypothetical protein AX14_009075 [Amanita brunnescens Koide BX004]|nr:hypothetical protein AX14_009075 [Amanita brunnescens Koide BX004]
MDSSVVQRLMRIEEDLLDAIISDGAALEQCAQDLSQLCVDIKTATVSQQLQDTTIQLVHAVVSRVIILSLSISRARRGLHKDVNDLFAAMSLNEQPPDIHCISVPRSTSTLPLYVKPAYTWLMENLHNPYPPKHIKATLSRESGCNAKDIDNWFINVRRRIGWNRVRRVHFANKRQEILSAAAHFFGKTDGSPNLDSHIEMEFASIQNLAENLYNDKFTDVQYLARSESPKESGDSDVGGSVDGDARPTRNDAKHSREEHPANPTKRMPPSLSAGPQIARTTKRHRDDQEADSRKAAKKRRIDDTESANQISSFPRTPMDNVLEGSAIPNEPTNSRKRRRSLSLDKPESCTRQPSAMEPTSLNAFVPDPLPVDTLLSNLWPFDNTAFCSAFSAEQTLHPDLSLPLEIELFDSSQLFANVDALTATQGVQDHTVLHPNPSLDIPSIFNDRELTSHDEQSCECFGTNSYDLLTPSPSYIRKFSRIYAF